MARDANQTKVGIKSFLSEILIARYLLYFHAVIPILRESVTTVFYNSFGTQALNYLPFSCLSKLKD